jgi:NAD(P)-dependent dehydrogenase (short-subunit alcohol dehydrogenase family)
VTVTGRVDGQVAVVTGAAGGLGRQFCLDLAREGAQVAGLDITDQNDTASAVTAAGGEFLAVTADITDERTGADAIAQVTREFGAPTILINNAGTYPVTPFEETSLAQWRHIHTLNVEGTFLMTKAVLPGMRAAGWGRIVMISSAVVFLGPPGMAAYTASKAAIIGLTRVLATELGDAGITVNAIAPGLTRTETALSTSVNAHFDRVIAGQAVPHAEQAADLSSTLLYVCDRGSAFLTGQTINVDGGFAKH